LSVWEHLKLICDIKGIKKKDVETEIEDAMQKLMISLYFDKRAEELAPMLRRKLALAMAIIGKPSFLFLDEPTVGLDIQSKKQFWELVHKIKGRMTIIITTSDMLEAENVASRIGILQSGKLSTIDSPEGLKRRYGVGYNLIVSQTAANAEFEKDIDDIVLKSDI
jgi:ABC-type multidrug transport system ATPase subunit